VHSAVPPHQGGERIRYLELACRMSDLIIVNEADRVQAQLDIAFAPSATLIGKSPESWLDEVLVHTVTELSRRGRLQLSAQETDNWCNAVSTVSGAADRLYGLLTKNQSLRRWVTDDYFSPFTLHQWLLSDWFPEIGKAGSRLLSCHLLYQTDAVRDAIIAAAESGLDLKEHRALFPEDMTGWRESTLVWRAPDLELRMHVRQAHTLVTELGGAEAPRRGRETREAIAGRRGEVTAFLRDEDASQLAVVEIEPKKTFAKRTRDPKFAVRLGCADAGRVSQFINPVPETESGRRGKKKDLAADLAYRAEAAWEDGLRQLGLSFVPEHSIKGDAIPDKLNQVAFWMVRRNVSAQFSARQFTPIAVLIRPDQDCIMGRTAGMQQWVPYPQLLRRLAGQERGNDMKTKAQRRAETARFVRQVLYTLRGEHTVVLTHAQNARQSWDWLQDGLLEPDKIQLGDGPVQSLALQGRNLRIIRVRDGERDETAQWWAPHEDDEDKAGLSKGLWVPPGPEDDRRVFYATGAKGASHQFSRVEDAKLTGHATDEAPDGEINAGSAAWNPTLLEITVAGCAAGDRPVDWAMWVQQQRFPDHYRDEGLKLPLALHLAAKATEYALPQEYAEARLLEDLPEDGTTISDDGTDDTEETGGTLALADDEGEA
jgi:hypothetical protein